MKATFTARVDHEISGELGWLDDRIASSIFQPLTYSVGLAHDTLEHFTFGSVADEIMAHGAMYWIRVEGGYTDDYGRCLVEQSFAHEWDNLYRGLVEESYLPDPPRTRTLDQHIEDFISEIIEQGRRGVLAEYPESSEDIERIARVFRAYFRMGYRKARRRYRCEAWRVAQTFIIMQKEFRRHLPAFEGEKLTVTFDCSKEKVHFQIDDSQNDW